MIILVSSCLIGHKVRYDGSDKQNDFVMSLGNQHILIPVCPECLGGLKIPRLPSEIANGKVLRKDGLDLSDCFNKGANKALEIALKSHIDFAILKSKSPSCGYHKIYDGSFNGKLIDGNGVFTSLLLKHNIQIFNEDDIELIQDYIKKIQSED